MDLSKKFQNIIAQNVRLNGSLKDGHDLQKQITASGVSFNPRLYANQTGGHQAGMIPETATQDNSDLPTWANADGLGNLKDQGVPEDLAIYLQVWVGERANFYNVRGVLDELKTGKSMSQALT